jgi:catechol 2,3-dioxygenase-like lactoylglutathione lyase family enzyme
MPVTLASLQKESATRIPDKKWLQSPSDIDAMYNLLKEIGAQVLDPPAEYPYSPGYFAIYFTDPDGLKFEFAYVPGA